jgi:hypothetical protein
LTTRLSVSGPPETVESRQMEAGRPLPPTDVQPTGSVAPPAERRDRLVAAVCALLLLIGMPIGYLSGDPSTGDVIGLIVLSAVSLALMAFLLIRFIPRERIAAPGRAPRTALILGILAVVTGVGFWTGIPFALGAAAIALGLSLRERTPADGRATAAVVLGAVAVVASFLLLLFG